jgi:protein-tyrosine phosphatase/membrane-associated phospholipid phosphatase
MTTAMTIRISPDRPPWRWALLWLAGLTPFFFLSYGFANWLTGLRRDVPSLVFGWEHRIPFVAWTILPYWSIDVLYALSLFVCRTRRELTTHVKRLVAAQVISISVFLLFPLRYTFERPQVTSLFGWMFDTLASFDKPFNQAPSLHLSLTAILLANYSQHLRGGMLWLIRVWMILVGVSTLTTYQHHFIDLPTGIWVGLFCLVLFPDNPPAMRQEVFPDPQRMRLGTAYLVSSVLLVGLADRIGGAAWWLLWPAGALSIVGWIYFSGRPELFQKSNGVMPLPMMILLAPYLAGAWLNSRLWTWRGTQADEITEGIWLGRMPRKTERNKQTIASIVDLTAELPVDTTGTVYRGVPMLDLVAPAVEEIETAVDAIDELRSARPTLVCCALGYSRSAAALAAWLTATQRSSSLSESIELIRARRPQVVLGSAQRARLNEWCRARGGV